MVGLDPPEVHSRAAPHETFVFNVEYSQVYSRDTRSVF